MPLNPKAFETHTSMQRRKVPNVVGLLRPLADGLKGL